MFQAVVCLPSACRSYLGGKVACACEGVISWKGVYSFEKSVLFLKGDSVSRRLCYLEGVTIVCIVFLVF